MPVRQEVGNEIKSKLKKVSVVKWEMTMKFHKELAVIHSRHVRT